PKIFIKARRYCVSMTIIVLCMWFPFQNRFYPFCQILPKGQIRLLAVGVDAVDLSQVGTTFHLKMSTFAVVNKTF
ncbi:hypothetical protein L9F63_001687, partial [Diploptera punctata]